MPWTFSHPAIVFPIKQSRIGHYFNLPALIIGSVSPDLFYSVGLYSLSTKAHHFLGWFYIAFPLCIVLFLLFAIFSTTLEKILPIPIDIDQKWNVTNCMIVITSLFIGAATHILWDGFTHNTGFFVRNIHILQYNLFNFITNTQELRIYKILQYLGSLLGLLYLCFKYNQYQQRLTISNQRINKRKLCQLLKIGVISGGITFPIALYLANKGNHFNVNKLVFHELRIAELIFFVLIFIVALFIRYRSPKT